MTNGPDSGDRVWLRREVIVGLMALACGILLSLFSLFEAKIMSGPKVELLDMVLDNRYGFFVQEEDPAWLKQAHRDVLLGRTRQSTGAPIWLRYCATPTVWQPEPFVDAANGQLDPNDYARDPRLYDAIKRAQDDGVSPSEMLHPAYELLLYNAGNEPDLLIAVTANLWDSYPASQGSEPGTFAAPILQRSSNEIQIDMHEFRERPRAKNVTVRLDDPVILDPSKFARTTVRFVDDALGWSEPGYALLSLDLEFSEGSVVQAPLTCFLQVHR